MRPRKSDFHTSATVPAGVLLVGLFSLGACAAPGKPLIYVEPSAASRHYSTMVVAPVKNGGMSAAQPELLERTGQRLRLKLKESGFAVQDDQASPNQQNYLRVNAIMQKYEGVTRLADGLDSAQVPRHARCWPIWSMAPAAKR